MFSWRQVSRWHGSSAAALLAVSLPMRGSPHEPLLAVAQAPAGSMMLTGVGRKLDCVDWPEFWAKP